MRVKLFWINDPMGPRSFLKSSQANAVEFEEQINNWLRDHPGVRIVDIKQSASGGYGPSLWCISIWYEQEPA